MYFSGDIFLHDFGGFLSGGVYFEVLDDFWEHSGGYFIFDVFHEEQTCGGFVVVLESDGYLV